MHMDPTTWADAIAHHTTTTGDTYQRLARRAHLPTATIHRLAVDDGTGPAPTMHTLDRLAAALTTKETR